MKEGNENGTSQDGVAANIIASQEPRLALARLLRRSGKDKAANIIDASVAAAIRAGMRAKSASLAPVPTRKDTARFTPDEKAEIVTSLRDSGYVLTAGKDAAADTVVEIKDSAESVPSSISNEHQNPNPQPLGRIEESSLWSELTEQQRAQVGAYVARVLTVTEPYINNPSLQPEDFSLTRSDGNIGLSVLDKVTIPIDQS